MSDNNDSSRNTRPVPANDPGSIPLQISEDDAATLVSRDITCDDGDFTVMTPAPTTLHRPTVSRGGDSVVRPSGNRIASAAVIPNNTSLVEDENNTSNQEGDRRIISSDDARTLTPSRIQQQQDTNSAAVETASQNRSNLFAASSFEIDYETTLEEDARAKAAAGRTTATTARDDDAKQKRKPDILVDGDGAASMAASPSSKDGKMIDGDGAAATASSVASQFSDEPASRGSSLPESSTTSRTSTTQPITLNLSSHPGAYSISNPLHNNNQNNTNNNNDPPSRALSEQESLLLVQASLVQESSVGTNIMRQTYGELVQASPMPELPSPVQDTSPENVVISRRSIRLAALAGCVILIALAVGIGVMAATGSGDNDGGDGSSDSSTLFLESSSDSSNDSDADIPTAFPSVGTFGAVGSVDTTLLPTIIPGMITEEDKTAIPTTVSTGEVDTENSEQLFSTISPTSLPANGKHFYLLFWPLS